MNMTLSTHSKKRVRQRGIKESDIPVIVGVATQMNDKSFLMRTQDVNQQIRKYKQAISTLERLCGCCVIIAGETVITVYHTSHKTEKRLLRGQ